jgi:hypothetical protein
VKPFTPEQFEHIKREANKLVALGFDPSNAFDEAANELRLITESPLKDMLERAHAADSIRPVKP